MTVEVVQASLPRRAVTFYHDVIAEMKRVTWPDVPQVRQLSISVIALALFVGGVIAVMDVLLQQILVVGLPKLFGG